MKTKHWILAGLVGLLACAGIVCAQNAAPRRNFRAARLARLLNLTPDQRTRARAIVDAGREQAKPVAAQLKTAREALANAVKSNAPDAQIDQLAAAVGPLATELASIRAKSAVKLYSILTPEQRTRFDELKQRRRAGRALDPLGD